MKLGANSLQLNETEEFIDTLQEDIIMYFKFEASMSRTLATAANMSAPGIHIIQRNMITLGSVGV